MIHTSVNIRLRGILASHAHARIISIPRYSFISVIFCSEPFAPRTVTIIKRRQRSLLSRRLSFNRICGEKRAGKLSASSERLRATSRTPAPRLKVIVPVARGSRGWLKKRTYNCLIPFGADIGHVQAVVVHQAAGLIIKDVLLKNVVSGERDEIDDIHPRRGVHFGRLKCDETKIGQRWTQSWAAQARSQQRNYRCFW